MRAVRADALFASAVQCSDEPTARQVRRAVVAAIGAYGGLGCAARVAQEFGEHPETAVLRMRWARMTVAGAFGGPIASAAPAEHRHPGSRLAVLREARSW
jgi:hypothetical protein